VIELSDRHRRFLRVDQGLVPAIFNVVINGAIAWALLRGHPEIPLWGETSVGVDLIATGFLLPFLTCLIVSRLIAGQVRSGRLPALESHQIASRGWHRRSSLRRGLLLGGVGVVFASAPVVAALEIAQAPPIALLPFVGFKAVWAGLLAGVLSPLIAWWALASASLAAPVARGPAAATLAPAEVELG
jgi:hypothetical protein